MWEIRQGDALERLREMPDESVQCCVTSPPYWGLRDYGIPATDWPTMTYTLPGGDVEVDAMSSCLGLEPTPEQFVGHLTLLMREVFRVLLSGGTLWLNIGDSYAGGGCGARDPERWPKQSRSDHMPTHAKRGHGAKTKDLIGVPWLVAFALRADGWFLRAENIWHKPTPMPESVRDRTTRAHEQIFLLSKSARYHYDNDAVRTPLAAKTLTTFGTQRKQNGGGDLVKSDNWARDVPNREAKRGEDGEPVGANLRSVWPLASKPFPAAHFATFPPDLAEVCILAGAPGGALVLDPFAGAATTGLVATQLGRDFVGIELNPEYVTLGEDRIRRWEANPAGHLTGDPEPLDGQLSIEEAAA